MSSDAVEHASAPSSHTLPAGTGRAYLLPKDCSARIVNLHGSQVIDTWAFARSSPAEFMSMEHTRGVLGRIAPRAGDDLYTNQRRALLRIERDTSPGIHDTLIPACDPERYRLLGHHGFHRNCRDNFTAAAAQAGLDVAMPAPLNLFMNIPVMPDGTLRFEPSVCRPGDFVTLRALEDVYLVLSACPQDIVPINGRRLAPADVGVVIDDSSPALQALG